MDEYIKRKDAIAGLRNVDDVWYVKAVPSYNVVPLVCGEWLEVQFRTVPYNRIEKAKKCSICGKRKDKYVIWKYCPNCGAKMKNDE